MKGQTSQRETGLLLPQELMGRLSLSTISPFLLKSELQSPAGKVRNLTPPPELSGSWHSVQSNGWGSLLLGEHQSGQRLGPHKSHSEPHHPSPRGCQALVGTALRGRTASPGCTVTAPNRHCGHLSILLLWEGRQGRTMEKAQGPLDRLPRSPPAV